MKKQASRSKSKARTKTAQADAISLILADHKPIKELISILKDSEVSFSKKQSAFEKFERTLSTHAKAEEESLYVDLKDVDDLRQEGI